MSKKQHLLTLCVGLGVLAVLAGAICFHAIATQDSKNTAPTEEPAVAALGRYQLTESTFKDYLLLSAMEDGGESTLLAAAQKYAKAQIAAEEIADTKYAVSEQQKADIQAQEKDSFQRDYEENTAFCITYGITSEDLVRTVVTSKINVLVQGQHFSFVTERFLENERKNGKSTDYSVVDNQKQTQDAGTPGSGCRTSPTAPCCQSQHGPSQKRKAFHHGKGAVSQIGRPGHGRDRPQKRQHRRYFGKDNCQSPGRQHPIHIYIV